jgi:aspartyl-tRNA(Asn)/glutamyl-tRNA(Gln) amidotransferase subunit A
MGRKPIYLGNFPARNADVVQPRTNEGAIVVGKTTTHEFAWGATTGSLAFGDTLNPYYHNRYLAV